MGLIIVCNPSSSGSLWMGHDLVPSDMSCVWWWELVLVSLLPLIQASTGSAMKNHEKWMSILR